MAQGKQIQVKVYNRQGVLVRTATDVTLGAFDWVLNGGLGRLLLVLHRKIDDFGEGYEIDLLYRVEVRIIDRETPPAGRLIYQGYIENYEQLAQGNEERVDITCLGYQTLFAKRIHQDSSGNTTLAYGSRDPSYIVKDAIEKMNGRIVTSSSSVENTGLSLSYTFRNNTVKEVLDKVIDLSPDGYYWFTDPSNVLNFAQINYDKPNHYLKFGKDVSSIRIRKSVDKMVNRVYFIGGGEPNLFRKSTRDSSLNEFGVFEERISDQRVTVTATADQIATNALDRYDHPTVQVSVTIVDSNIAGHPEGGFDIEQFRPGQVVKLENLVDERNSLWDVSLWDVDFWDFDFRGALANPFVITKINYEFTKITLELGEFQDIFGRDFKKLEDKLNTESFQNLPAAPTTV